MHELTLVMLGLVTLVCFTASDTGNNTTVKVLSRRRRYLTFPAGSSLQLVYCLTMPTLGQGNIFTMGGTAAVAWQLPSDSFITMRMKFRQKIKERTEKIIAMMQAAQAAPPPPPPPPPPKSSMRNDYVAYNNKDKNNYYSNKIDYFKNYYQQKSTSPVLNQSSSYYATNQGYKPSQSSTFYQGWGNSNSNNNNNKDQSKYYYDEERRPQHDYKGYRKRLQPYSENENDSYDANSYHYQQEYENQFHKELHRRTRRDMYAKIEKFFVALNKNGRACLMKAICEVSKTSQNEKGTFLEEILKAIFSVKSHEHFPEENDEYDMAANTSHNCTERYPDCPSSIWNIF